MLESGNLGGKCADLSALFVGLARSVGIPARDVYGVRVADSATWKSLGKSGDITKAQHCRAEFYHPKFGWIPVDPADVRKVVLEEEKGRLLPLNDPRVRLARQTLFGTWEMNWVAFNTAGDTKLAPETAKSLGHFMYPYAEGAKGPLDYYDPDNFQYRMQRARGECLNSAARLWALCLQQLAPRIWSIPVTWITFYTGPAPR